MNVFAINPFYSAYEQSDVFGKLIFIGLILLSLISWILIAIKFMALRDVRKEASLFQKLFKEKRAYPLSLTLDFPGGEINPCREIYQVMKTQAVELLNKNRKFGQANIESGEKEGMTYLSPSDMGLLSTHIASAISGQMKALQKNLFLLSTIVSLAPFLGLLGTVWGILMSFAGLQTSMGASNQMVLSGLSTALATTVLGLLVAIPALVGFNYFKSAFTHYESDIEDMATVMLASVEFQYRKVDVD